MDWDGADCAGGDLDCKFLRREGDGVEEGEEMVGCRADCCDVACCDCLGCDIVA